MHSGHRYFTLVPWGLAQTLYSRHKINFVSQFPSSTILGHNKAQFALGFMVDEAAIGNAVPQRTFVFCPYLSTSAHDTSTPLLPTLFKLSY
jgi:hypothetical protein